ncbi:hypothetical protein [Paenibacillus odorifer]|uniref:hypothetical protein n=1 Tax=Paenibacillus odorifer TaxID=189426 RepID=UPI00096C5AE3|nr:hypothetical protein [Paenibacillus odorifer]OME06749.1 hypothetical protein BSK60_32205 [Paenibacillus odorifer]
MSHPCLDIYYHHMPVNHPTTWTYPNDYKYPVAYDEKEFGARPIGIICTGGELVCMDEGSYHEPPVYDLDVQEILIINPIMKCWGRGLNYGSR